jgi:hypothetical protein
MRILPTTIFLSGFLILACGPAATQVPQRPDPEGSAQEDPSDLVPAGFGTLLQDQISLRLQSGRLLIKLTPLDEGIIRLTAPDTYERLRGLAEVHGPRAGRTVMGLKPSLFLVSLFSYEPDVTYEPEDLRLVNRGLRLRPEGIAPITPSWGTQRLGQQEARIAVYAFPGDIEWESELIVEYQQLRNETWRDQVLPVLEAEKAKVRARSGGLGSSAFNLPGRIS